MVFHWILNDSKSPQVSRTRLRIQAVHSNAGVWIVSTRPPTSKSSRPFNNPLVIVSKAPITIGTIVTFMFHSFFDSLARSRYLSFFSLSFRFILWTTGTAKSIILQILFFLLITEKVTPNDKYENFVESQLEVASKCIPTKPRTKYRVPWETSAVKEKRALVKTASKSYWKNPTNTNARKLEKAQYQLAGIYLKEQAEYIQNQIDKIRDSVEDRQSRIAWQTINEVSRRKNTAKAKLKATSQQERVKLWGQHFKTHRK